MVMRNKTPVSATYHGYIASSRDALLVIDAVLRGLLLPVTNRPTPKERKALIRSGNVFVFIEEESNIKRWTDGTSWSPSRILGRFLIYRELSKNIVKDSNNNLSAITSVVEDNGDSNNMDNGNASGSRATSTATNNNNNSTNNNGANNHYASTESRFVKLNCQPITAYAMAGGEDVIRKRSIDDVIKEDANSNNNNNNNNTDTNSTHNSIRGDTTISNTNEINTNLLNSNIEVDVLSDNIYRSDGLIKKSLSIVLHSPSRKTIHLVSYYTTKDVINNKLNIPSSDNFFKDNSVVPSYELIDSLLNTSLGHSISHRRRSDPSSGPISFLDTDGFDDQTVMSYTNHKRRRLSEQRQQQQQQQQQQLQQLQQQQQQQHQHQHQQQDKETVLLDAQKKKASATHITHRLPVEFMDCPIDFLIDLISRMLQSLITLNDKSVPNSISNPPSAATTTTSSSSATTNGGSQSSNSLLTRYHSRTPPAISTLTYLSRLTKFNNFNPAILLTTIYYIDLLSHQYQPFFTLNSWTVHRFLLVGTMIAQKSLEDFFYTNDHYAKVGGVALGELNCLELDFLSRVDWRCIPGKQAVNKILGTVCTNIGEAKDVLNMYYFQLIDLMGKNSHSGGQIQRDEQQGQQPAVYYVRAGSIGVGEENALKEDGSSATSEVQDDDMLDDDDDDDEEEGEGEEEDESDYYDDDDDDDDEDDGGGDGDDDDEEEGNSNNNTMIHPTSDTDYKLHPNLTQIYDKNGFVINGSSSPHLKRRYSGS